MAKSFSLPFIVHRPKINKRLFNKLPGAIGKNRRFPAHAPCLSTAHFAGFPDNAT